MHKWSESILKCVKTKVDGAGLDNLDKCDVEELELWTRIAKNIVCFDKDYHIVEAMKKAENEDNMEMIEQYEDYPEKKYYRGQPRDSKGRYMSRNRNGRRGYNDMMPFDYDLDNEMYEKYDPKTKRDLDRKMGRMYFMNDNAEGRNVSMNRDRREGHSGMARKTFMETKEMNKGNSPDENTANMQSLEDYLKALSEDITEMIGEMSPSEKAMTKQKIMGIANKMN